MHLDYPPRKLPAGAIGYFAVICEIIFVIEIGWSLLILLMASSAFRFEYAEFNDISQKRQICHSLERDRRCTEIFRWVCILSLFQIDFTNLS